MPGTPEHPVTLGDLRIRVIAPTVAFGEPKAIDRPATVADLVSALRAEGVIVIEKVDGEWPEWAINPVNEMSRRISKFVLDALAEAQPFPPAGGVS